ncbi:M14 family metallocarboxypeptidase [Pseudenhygromyxa sp. WMMC2535]|uniref:M14 family metallopeptidase n=1 Tax=Pseudenhygromyxa sp. WMMC2535 TaxID=2712867 RepID=UPI001555EE2E|nr:M14 family metallocarboxypeptidase [Pseudenhygromyxa sp. WMMC2535]NVB42555.1 M14 family metallocarboxypeptidase [Pseudenhygromyxa sp. WMMC2535]
MSETGTPERFYPIGTPGQPWTASERAAWRARQRVQRSYAEEVLAKLETVDPRFRVVNYGALSVDPQRYPLYVVQPATELADAPWVLITGGVHGYETSGVQGALRFLATRAASYADRLNLVIAPCVSPWGYEVINRWNPDAIDPNRSFVADSPAEECAALMAMLAEIGVDFLVHMDLHETTDSDEQEFRPALAARDGQAFVPGHIPDGFYTVGDTENPQAGFQAAIIAGVEQVTHIAEADAASEIIGTKISQRGVIDYPLDALGLCAGLTEARFTTTTEVYPDSPRATAEICDAAQVAAVCAGLDYALAH